MFVRMGRSIATDSSGHGFASFNEVKEANGARDRAQQEIFLCENKVALQELPLDALFDAWTQSHYPTLKMKAGNSKSVDTFFKKDFSSAKFMNLRKFQRHLHNYSL